MFRPIRRLMPALRLPHNKSFNTAAPKPPDLEHEVNTDPISNELKTYNMFNQEINALAKNTLHSETYRKAFERLIQLKNDPWLTTEDPSIFQIQVSEKIQDTIETAPKHADQSAAFKPK